MKSNRDPRALFDSHVKKAREHEIDGQLSLAYRELSEALRIRPRDQRVRNEIRRLESVAATTTPTLEPSPAERFASPFNLGVRYWDRNMPSVALKEALEALKSVGLPTTCVEHNISVIRDVMTSTRGNELKLREAVSGPKKNNLPLNYKLATLYFDRRMLQTAGKQLQRCKGLSQTLMELEATRRSAARAIKTARECDSRASSRRPSLEANDDPEYDETAFFRAKEKVSGVIDDLSHVKELEGLFCTLTDEVKVLPCLLSRFSEDVSECEAWWTDIRTSPLLDWRS